MAIILDIAIVIFAILSTYLGYKKGLIGVAFKILSFVLAILITFILFRPVSNYIINNTQIDDNIKNTIIEKLSGTKIEETGKIDEEDAQLPSIVVDYINESVSTTIENSKETIIQQTADNLTISAINIIVMITLFIVTRILLIFAKVIFGAIAELPFIKQFNECGGIIYGIIRAIVVLYIVFAIITLLTPMIDISSLNETINNSTIAKFLYNNNIILRVFLK